MWPFDSYPEVSADALRNEYDYIVLGGGTAGCVLANRLSSDPSRTVLVVERGPLADTWLSRIPLFSADHTCAGPRSLARFSIVQKIGRSFNTFTGCALGGGSRINAMIYTRGLPAEYDMWAQAGRKGWAWEDIRPYFIKSECCLEGAIEGVHGDQGEWRNRDLGSLFYRGYHETIQASKDLGLPYIDDLNSPTAPPFGCGRFHFTLDENGHRNSVYDAFLPLALARKRKANLHICTNTMVEKVNVEQLADGSVVTRGVTLLTNKREKRKFVAAAKEVVLSSGPFGSPHVLLLSGIGPSAHLKAHGISVVKHLPAVGSNLQDHVAVPLGWHNEMKDSVRSVQLWPWIIIMEVIRYLIWGTGLLLCPIVQVVVFANSNLLDATGKPTKAEKAVSHALPDVEIIPVAYSATGPPFPRWRGMYSMLNMLLRPRSRGTVRLSSADPRDPLVIDPRYLSDPADLVPLRAAMKLSLRLRDGMRARGYRLDDWMAPASERDAELDAYAGKWCSTTLHHSSTCRMAPEDDPDGGGVVDDELRVHGVRGLRVADTSIFPWVVGTHLQAPAVAVAEKCADMMLTAA